MTPAAVFTLAVIGLAILLIVKDVAPPDVMLFAALVVFMAAGVVTPEQGLAGFGNPAVATVGALFIVAAGIRSTGVLEGASRAILGSGGRIGRALVRLIETDQLKVPADFPVRKAVVTRQPLVYHRVIRVEKIEHASVVGEDLPE